MYRRYYVIRENAANSPSHDKPWLMDLRSHGIVIGKTGSGKSNYLLHILRHIDREDCNIVLLDPHGQTSDSFLSMTKREAIILSGHDYPGSEGRYSGINALHTSGEEENAYRVGDWMVQAFSSNENMSNGTWGPRINMIISQVMVNIMLREKGLPLDRFTEILADQKRLFSYFPVQEHSPIRNALSSGNITRNWGDFIMSSLNKLLPLVGNPLIRRVISVSEEKSVNLDHCILTGNKLISPEISIGETGVTSASIIASVLLARIWNILVGRGPSDYKTYIIIDEAHIIPESVLDMFLSQGRKYGVILILAYQSLGQLTDKFRDVMFSNLNNYACFNLTERDAKYISDNITWSSKRQSVIETLVNQPRHYVTVTCNHVEADGTSSSNSGKYGPITLKPPLIAHAPDTASVQKIKASIINRIGYGEENTTSSYENSTLHNRLIFLFSDFLESRNVKVTVEPNIGNLIPDILVEHNGRIIYCEVEDSDLMVSHRIAKKMVDYMGNPIIFLCRDEDFGKIVSIFRNMVGHAGDGGFYQNGDEIIPFSKIPEALMNTSLVTYSGNTFSFFNGIKKVKFSPMHLEKDSSFMNRAKKLPYGNLRLNILLNLVETVRDGGGVDLYVLEAKYGRDKLRELLQVIRDSGYSEGLTFNSLLELDRIHEPDMQDGDVTE